MEFFGIQGSRNLPKSTMCMQNGYTYSIAYKYSISHGIPTRVSRCIFFSFCFVFLICHRISFSVDYTMYSISQFSSGLIRWHCGNMITYCIVQGGLVQFARPPQDFSSEVNSYVVCPWWRVCIRNLMMLSIIDAIYVENSPLKRISKCYERIIIIFQSNDGWLRLQVCRIICKPNHVK